MNKQSLIAALEAEDKRSVKDMCSLAYRSGLRFALSLANQLDENVEVDERQEFEKAFLEAHAAYCHGYGLDSIFERYSKCSAAFAGEYCEYNVRSSWNMWQARSKLPVNPLTFLDDESVVEEVAKATEDAAYSECFSTKEKKREWHRHIAKAAIATIKRLAQNNIKDKDK